MFEPKNGLNSGFFGIRPKSALPAKQEQKHIKANTQTKRGGKTAPTESIKNKSKKTKHNAEKPHTTKRGK